MAPVPQWNLQVVIGMLFFLIFISISLIIFSKIKKFNNSVGKKDKLFFLTDTLKYND
jgi:uncharacterized membrane protein